MMLNKEAVVSIAVVEAVVLAAIPILARMFGWDLDLQDDVQVLAVAVVALVVPLVTALVQRAFVWSRASHNAEVSKALHRTPQE